VAWIVAPVAAAWATSCWVRAERCSLAAALPLDAEVDRFAAAPTESGQLVPDDPQADRGPGHANLQVRADLGGWSNSIGITIIVL
jgi:hypothetical protein